MIWPIVNIKIFILYFFVMLALIKNFFINIFELIFVIYFINISIKNMFNYFLFCIFLTWRKNSKNMIKLIFLIVQIFHLLNYLYFLIIFSPINYLVRDLFPMGTRFFINQIINYYILIFNFNYFFLMIMFHIFYLLCILWNLYFLILTTNTTFFFKDHFRIAKKWFLSLAFECIIILHVLL